MNRISKCLCLLFVCSGCACLGGEDSLRFLNGDLLHGSFDGLDADRSVKWQRDDSKGPITFKDDEIRKVILRAGQPQRRLRSTEHIGLANGDRIPGKIVSVGAKEVVLDTEFAGRLKFSRRAVSLLAPNPFGGKILYQGPFSEDGWEMIYPEQDEQDKQDDAPKVDFPKWIFSGSAWYWQNEGTKTALVRRNDLSDDAILKFDLMWKDRLTLGIVFHADFEVLQMKLQDRKRHVVGAQEVYGKSYFMQLHTNYVLLYRAELGPDEKPRLELVRSITNNLRLGDAGKASVELRCSRVSGQIMLFIDGNLVMQWSEGTKDDAEGKNQYAGAGHGFGFVVQSEATALRISNIVSAEWNGMPDAARSLEMKTDDIVLLTNGTDRFSGEIESVEGGVLKFSNRYGKFILPMTEVAEVKFATNRVSMEPESDQTIRILFNPLGRLSGIPLRGDKESLQLLTESAGQVDAKLEAAVLLELDPEEGFFDIWENDL